MLPFAAVLGPKLFFRPNVTLLLFSFRFVCGAIVMKVEVAGGWNLVRLERLARLPLRNSDAKSSGQRLQLTGYESAVKYK